MANQLKIDELNALDKKSNKMRSIPYRKYFSEMDLEEDEIEKRIKLAEALEEVFLFLFVMVGVEIAMRNAIDKEYYYSMVERRYLEALESQGIVVDDFKQIKEHVNEISKDIVDVTVADIDNTEQKKDIDPYLTSQDRAMFIAENETNGVRNCVLLNEAIKKGFKKKTWVTKHDKKVRHSHVLVDGETIGIYDTFHVGDSEMLFPLDDSLGASAREIVNCRCVLKFKKR